MGNKFSAFALDQLIKDCTGEVDQISTELSKYDSSQVISSGNPDTSKLINQETGASVDFSRVYSQLQKLIQNGNNTLQVLSSIQPDGFDIGIMAATATLMNAIKNCVSQFTKIHSMHLKYQMALDLQQKKQQHKKQIIMLKNDLKTSKQQIETQDVPLQEFSDKTTYDIFKYLQDEKLKRENN